MNIENVFIESGKILCLGSLGVGVGVELYIPKKFGGLDKVILRAFLAMVLIIEFQSIFSWLDNFGLAMAKELKNVLGEKSLKTIILNSFEESNSRNSGAIPSVTGAIGQSLRVGVWGILSAVVQYLFMVIGYLFEVTQHTLYHLNLVLFPIGLGMFPVFSSIATQMFLYAIELSLWLPILILVERLSAQVAEKFLTQEGSLGLPIVATEILGILLMGSVPVLAHKFVSGSFNGLNQASTGGNIQKGVSLFTQSASRIKGFLS